MTGHATLFREAANQIDALDAEIERLNADKKAVYDNLKETVTPADFRAWRDAVKLRRKSSADRDKADAHDARVFAILHDIEATGTPVATRARAPAAAREEPSHAAGGRSPAAEGAEAGGGYIHVASPATPPPDPETGEIIDELPSESTAPLGMEEGGAVASIAAPSSPLRDVVPDPAIIEVVKARQSDPGEIPAFLRRRRAEGQT